MRVLPAELARTLLRDLKWPDALTYAEAIARMGGEDAADYAEAAKIIKRKSEGIISLSLWT